MMRYDALLSETVLLHLTDTHLLQDSSAVLRGVNTSSSLDRIVELAKATSLNPDAIVITGDIAEDGSAGAYQSLLRSLNSFEVPIRWAPGNHDNPTAMEAVAGKTDLSAKSLTLNNWQIFLVDSTLNGCIQGNISRSELDWLDLCLSSTPDDIENTVVCLHHNPHEADAVWAKTIGLQNYADFFEVLDRHDSVRFVLHGHIHQERRVIRNNVSYFCTPSTCFQFAPTSNRFALDELSPGYRSLTLREDGSFNSEVHRL
jgi:Icc protein